MKKTREVSGITQPKYNVFWQPSLVPNKPLIAIETGSEKIARALMGNEEGDEVAVKAPKGDILYEIIEVQYI